MKPNDKKEKRVFYLYLAVFLIIGALIVLAGFQYHRNFEKNYRTNIENQLSLIADLKVDELEHWLEEQRGDAETIFGNEVFSNIIKHYFKNLDDRDSKRKIEVWMQEFQTGFKYDAVLFSFGIFLISGMGLGFVWRYQRTQLWIGIDALQGIC